MDPHADHHVPAARTAQVSSLLVSALGWRPGGYARASGSLFMWLLVRAAAQAAMVVWLSRMLGATDYGRFVAVVAVASFLTPFAGFGLSGVILRDGARRPDQAGAYLASALRVWVPSSIVCVALGIGAAYALLPDALPWLAVIALVAGEIMAMSITELTSRTEQACHRVAHYGAMNAGLSVARLAALAAYWLFARPTIGGWMWVYAASSLTYAVWLCWFCYTRIVHSDGLRPRLRLRDGMPFAIAVSSLRLQAEFNKPVLAHLGFQHAGNLNAAQRATDLASLPLIALQEALWPRLYASPNAGARLRTTGLALFILALVGGGLLWLAAPWLPGLLGDGFAETASLLRWLAWLPAIQLVRNFTTFRLIHHGRTKLLTITYLASAVIGIATVVWVIPLFGVTGAAMALYATEVALIAMQAGLSLPNRHTAIPSPAAGSPRGEGARGGS